MTTVKTNENKRKSSSTISVIELEANKNEQNENNNENKNGQQTIKDVFLEWMSNSTAHATPRIFKKIHIVLKIYWIIVMLASWAGCFYFLITTLLLYLKFGYNTNYEYVEEMPMVFPAIDICNLSPYDVGYGIEDLIDVQSFNSLDNETKLAVSEDEGILNIDDPFSDELGLNETDEAINDVFLDSNDEETRLLTVSGILNKNEANVTAVVSNVTNLKGLRSIVDAVVMTSLIRLENDVSLGKIKNLSSYSYSLKEMLLSCKFKGKACSTNDFTRYRNFFYGNCYRFNGKFDRKKRLVSPQTVSKAGWKYGLQLELYTGDQGVLSANQGFRILIHNQSDVAVFPEEDGIDIVPGFQTNVAVTKTWVQRLGAPYFECMGDLNETKYDYLVQKSTTMQIMKKTFKYIEYGQNLCVKMCLQKHTFDQCGCTDLTLPDYFADQSKINCNTLIELKCSNKTQTNFFNSNEIDRCMKDCPSECDFNQYATTISMSNYPSEWFKSFYAMDETTREIYPTYIASVNIFYDQLIYNRIYQTQAFTAEVFFGSFGGQLGLFMGLSLLSVCELIELIILLIMFLIRKMHNARKVNSKKN